MISNKHKIRYRCANLLTVHMVPLDTWQAQIQHFPDVLLISDKQLIPVSPVPERKEYIKHNELNKQVYQIRSRFSCS